MPIDRKAAKATYKNTITPMGIYCLRNSLTGRCVVAADHNLPSVMGRLRFIAGLGSAQPGGPFSDPQLCKDFSEHPEAFVFDILEEVDISKCASYEEAADKLEVLERAARHRYDHLQRYLTK